MPARNEPALHGRRVAQRLRTAFGAELLAGRLDAGISQRTAGTAAGMSHTQFGRMERGQLRRLTFDQAAPILRARLVEARRSELVVDWLADLRRRTDVVILAQ